MFSFLRKYQKVVLGAVTAALVISISFFGSYQAITQRPSKEVDEVIGTALNGSSISKLDTDRMVRFLSRDKLDRELDYVRQMPNLFNDGVISKDFLETGLAQMLVESYFDVLQDDLSTRFEKGKRFKPYIHPKAPYLSAENLWTQFVPSMKKNLFHLRTHKGQITPDDFKVMTELYLDNSKLPSSLLRRVLSYQEGQYQGIPKDSYLDEGDLSLFYFHTVEDWFGLDFVELVAQFIHNAAIYAKQKGYVVNSAEARSDLLRQGYEALVAQGKEEVTPNLLDQYWKQTLAMLRLTEKQVVSLWQEVLLFRKLFNDYGQSVFLDTLAYKQYNSYAAEAAEVKLYALPKQFQLGDFRSLLKYQVYLEAVLKDQKETVSLDCPKTFKTKEELLKTAPQLLEKSYQVEMSSLTKREIASTVTLKQMWQWQLSDAGWSVLRETFKYLPIAKTEEERFEALEKLKDELAEEINIFSRNQIVVADPSRVVNALKEAPLETKTLLMTLKGEHRDLKGIDYSENLVELLDQAVLSKNIEGPLEAYSQDGQHYYRICVLEALGESKLLTFQEASSKGVLDKILDNKLKAYHEQARAHHPSQFQNEDGSFKDFAAVKNQIGSYVYKDLLAAIEKDVAQTDKKLKGDVKRESLDFYATHRFYHFVRKAQEDILKNGDASVYLSQEAAYHMEAKEEVVKRKDKVAGIGEELFSMEEKTFSPLYIGNNGTMSFYQVIKKTFVDERQLAQEVQKGQQMMAKDARLYLMSEMLGLIRTTDSIHLEKMTAKVSVQDEDLEKEL